MAAMLFYVSPCENNVVVRSNIERKLVPVQYMLNFYFPMNPQGLFLYCNVYDKFSEI